jgi:dTDP-4-amino-4,6-dideoxygalactose transaminase
MAEDRNTACPFLNVAEPVIGAEEQAALAKVIEDGWITMGANVRAFELAFADRHGALDAVAVSSCTAALHLILEALGIGPGDEVLVPSLTFVASVNCVAYVGATPVFVDIESLSDPLISIDDAAAKCSPRTKAAILVHYAGNLADREAWRSFAASRRIYLIEDSAHAIGIEGVGSYGDAAAFSFYGNKNMTTAEGGMILARDPSLLDRIRQMRGHGMTSATFQRHSSGKPQYDVTMLGYNYRMDELRAAVGLVQLAHLAEWNARRRSLAVEYANALGCHCPGVLAPTLGARATAHHIMPVVLPPDADRDAIIAALRSAGIQTTIHYPPVHLLSYYRTRHPEVSLPLTEEYCLRELTLPMHPRMDASQVERVVVALADALGARAKNIREVAI